MISRDDEPAVRQPGLLELVELARAQPLPPLRVDAETILRGVAHRRSARVRTVVVGVLLSAAALWLLWARLVPAWMRVSADAPVEQAPRVLDEAPAGGEVTAREEPSIVRAPPMIEAPPSAPEPIVAPPIEPAAPEEVPEVSEPAASTTALSLARQAEQAMAERRRGDAIALLTKIVRTYPRHPAAKAALFDLGRLFRDAGRRDEARCAYRMLERRWPDGPGADEVGAMLVLLGEGPRCHGLRPVSSR